MHCSRHPLAAAKSGAMDPAEVGIISVLIESQKVLCIRIASESSLISQAAHILDGCLAHLQMSSSRMEAEETDVSKQLLPLFREVGIWSEVKNVSLLELEGTRAIGAGSNIKARRRSAWLAMALALVVSAGRRGHNPYQLTRLLSGYGLDGLATTAWHVMLNKPPLSAQAEGVSGAHTQGMGPMGPSAAPDPQQGARRPAEPASEGRSRWSEERRQERSSNPTRPTCCRDGQVVEEGISSGAYTQGMGGMGMASEFHQPQPEPSVQIPPHAPTLEDNFDFAIGLYPGLVSNSTRVLIFNDPIGVEEC